MSGRTEDEGTDSLPLGPLGEALARKTGGATDPEKVLAKAMGTDVTAAAQKLIASGKSETEAYKALAPEHADILGELAQEIAQLNRDLPDWRDETGKQSDRGHALEAEFKRISEENQFALKLFHERKEERRREQIQSRIAAREERKEELFSRATDSFTLRDAVAVMDGDFALRYRYFIVDDNRERIQRKDREGKPMTTRQGEPLYATRDGVVLLSCSGGTAEIIDCTQRSVMERMSGKRVPLRPADEFETNRGEPFFSIPIREGLVRRWKAEEANTRRHGMSERREISFTEGASKKGVAVAHWPPQRPYLSGKRKGPLSVVISFTGKGNFTLGDVFSSQFEEFLALAVGQKLSLELPDEPTADADEETRKAFQRHKFLVNLINRRVEYETIQSAREAAREAEGLNTDEPEEEASSEETAEIES